MEIDTETLLIQTAKQKVTESEEGHSTYKKQAKSEGHETNENLKGENNTLDQYQYNNKGPFGTWVRKAKNIEGDFNIYKLANIIYKKSKIDIKRKGRYKAEVLLNNRIEVNSLIKNKNVIEKGMEPFIPTFRMVREGVVNGIPTEYSEEELLEAAESNIEIKDIKRINKRVKNHDDNLFTWVPSKAIIVTFTG